MRVLWGLAFLTVLTVCALAEASDQRLEFVTLYMRQLATQESIRDDEEKELDQASTPVGQLQSCIHGSTALQLELGTEIGMLKDTHFDAPFDQLVPTIIDVYNKKIDLNQRLIDICSAVIGPEKPGVDYDAMAAEMPKIRAVLESMDQTLHMAAGLAFGLLIDQRADSKNHASHLIITKAERAELLHAIDESFGKKLDDKNANDLVSSGVVLKYLLTEKGYRCADEPWE